LIFNRQPKNNGPGNSPGPARRTVVHVYFDFADLSLVDFFFGDLPGTLSGIASALLSEISGTIQPASRSVNAPRPRWEWSSQQREFKRGNQYTLLAKSVLK
jgi:hypothetical protein